VQSSKKCVGKVINNIRTVTISKVNMKKLGGLVFCQLSHRYASYIQNYRTDDAVWTRPRLQNFRLSLSVWLTDQGQAAANKRHCLPLSIRCKWKRLHAKQNKTSAN